MIPHLMRTGCGSLRVSDEGHAPGAAGLHLTAGLGLLRPEEQAFTAMHGRVAGAADGAAAVAQHGGGPAAGGECVRRACGGVSVVASVVVTCALVNRMKTS